MLNNIHSDLIRGHIDTIILRSLFKSDRYGYDICKEIEQSSGNQYKLKQPTLYSCLKRLESQGFISAYWGEQTKGSRRKYYTLTEQGRNLFLKNQIEWEYSRTVIDRLISDRKFDLDALAPAFDSDERQAMPSSISRDVDEDDEDIVEDEDEDKLIDEDKPASEDEDKLIDEDESDTRLAAEEAAITIDRNPTSADDSESDQDPLVTAFWAAQGSDNKHSYAQSLKHADDEDNSANDAQDGFAARFNTMSDELLRLSELENAEAQKRNDETRRQLFDAPPPRPAAAAPHAAESQTEREYKAIIAKMLRSSSPKFTAEEQTQSQKAAPNFVINDNDEEQFKSSQAEQGSDDAQAAHEDVHGREDMRGNDDRHSFAQSFAGDREQYRATFKEDAPHYNFNFRSDESAESINQDSIFFNINPDEFVVSNTKIRAHTKGASRQYNSQFYYYSNKLRLVNMSITGLLMFAEALIMMLVFHSTGVGTFSSNAGIYILSLLLPVALIATSMVLYKINPFKKQRAQFNFVNGTIFWIIFFVFSLMLIFSLNLALDMRITNYTEYIVRLVVPMVLSTNFVVNNIVFYLLFKSKKFAV